MACPTGLDLAANELAPPDPVTTGVKIKIRRGGTLYMVIETTIVNGQLPFGIKFVGTGWDAEGRTIAGTEACTVSKNESFDGDEATDHSGWGATNEAIPPLNSMEPYWDT